MTLNTFRDCELRKDCSGYWAGLQEGKTKEKKDTNEGHGTFSCASFIVIMNVG